MRIIVIGAVKSTLKTLEGLVKHHANLVGVLCLDPTVSKNVSGYSAPNLMNFCKANKIPFSLFTHINSEKSCDTIRSWAPDVIFAVGFSQIIDSDLLSIPSIGLVGFHPTRLPEGRGRAPLAWITYQKSGGAATFFQIKDGVDDGPIFVQENFDILPEDHAGDVENKLMIAIDRALDQWLPKLFSGEWHPALQNEGRSRYFGIRKPLDGLIEWHEPFDKILGKIRAASRPHPGAFTFTEDRKIILWRARRSNDLNFRGIPGRVLMICPERGVLVQAGEGLLWLTEIQDAEKPNQKVQLRVGQLLGYVSQYEIFKLKKEVEELKTIIRKISSQS